MHETGNQRNDHRDNRHSGNGVGKVKPVPPKPTTRLTLRQMREKAGIPLGELASQAGVSTSTLRMFENGIPDLAPATYAHSIAALAALIARPAA
jgi:DNA-binding XRE family transcriptional regulator